MLFETIDLEVHKNKLNDEYRSMKGDTFVSSDYIHVTPLVSPLPKHIGGYQIYLYWNATVDDQFTGARVLEMDAIQVIFILPEGDNDNAVLRELVALSQQAFADEVSKYCTGTPLKDFKFAEIDYAVIADEILAYIAKQYPPSVSEKP